MEINKLKDLLEQKIELVKLRMDDFIRMDPVQIPGQFKVKEDIEIAAFLTAIIAWGQRKTILANAQKLMALMDYAPHDFILHHNEHDLRPLNAFVHRTFNASDLLFFIERLRRMYAEEGGLEQLMLGTHHGALDLGLNHFKAQFFDHGFLERSQKHLANPLKKSTAKRLLMFLRWMVRTDLADFGIWTSIKPKDLLPPLDVHSAKSARQYDLLHRQQNDWKAVEELGANLRRLNPNDPVRYDYVLYGEGAFDFLG